MNRSIQLDPKKETLPTIKPGDYGFYWTATGEVQITNRKGEVKVYSVDALSTLSRSRGMPLAIRNMAWAALEWMEDNPRS